MRTLIFHEYGPVFLLRDEFALSQTTRWMSVRMHSLLYFIFGLIFMCMCQFWKSGMFCFGLLMPVRQQAQHFLPFILSSSHVSSVDA